MYSQAASCWLITHNNPQSLSSKVFMQQPGRARINSCMSQNSVKLGSSMNDHEKSGPPAAICRPSDTSVTELLPLGSDPELRRKFLIVNEPLKANFRFGLLLEVLDMLAERAALDYARRSDPQARVVTAAIDNIRVRRPADSNRDVLMKARLNYVGRSSMEVGVRIEQPGDPPDHIASCYFTMVARSGLGDQAQSIPMPPLAYVDDLEQMRAAKAIARREAYQHNRDAANDPPNKQEYAMLAALHAAQEQPDFAGGLAGRLTTSSWDRTYPEHEYVPTKIFGGHVIHRA
jgi:acyl-coenzyme A thioesterase 9